MKITIIIAASALYWFATCSAISQEQVSAAQRIRQWANTAASLSELSRIGFLKDSKMIPVADLELVLTKRGDELFSGEEQSEKVWAEITFCKMVEANPDRATLVPKLIERALQMEPVDPKLPVPNDWDKIRLASHGGRLGYLMDFVLRIAGQEGFRTLYEGVIEAHRPDKLPTLLTALRHQKNAEQYLTMLREIRSREANPNCKEQLDAAIDQLSLSPGAKFDIERK